MGDLTYMGVRQGKHWAKTMNQTKYGGELNTKLEPASNHGSPRGDFREMRQVEPVSEENQSRDNRNGPGNGSGIRNKESMMPIENPKAPRGQDQETRSGQEDAHRLA